MQTEIELFFGDGAYSFRLGLRQIVAIEEKCGPIGEVYSRLLQGRYAANDATFGAPAEGAYRIHDLIEVIRQGLIGGGKGMVDGVEVAVTPLTANKLIDAYVLGQPLKSAWDFAVSIMTALYEGYEPPEKKGEPGADPASLDVSTGPKSSPPAP